VDLYVSRAGSKYLLSSAALCFEKWKGQQMWSGAVLPFSYSHKFPPFGGGNRPRAVTMGEVMFAQKEKVSSTHLFFRAAKDGEKRPSSDEVDGKEFKASERDLHLLF
jgi:hypothetical protein